jgi:hypothetical protein
LALGGVRFHDFVEYVDLPLKKHKRLKLRIARNVSKVRKNDE